MKDEKEWLAQAHIDIQQGKGRKVLNSLRKMEKDGEKPTDLVAFSQLARRVGMYHFATKILFKKVRNQSEVASTVEVAEYAAALSSMGNNVEALELFQQIDAHQMTDYVLEYVGLLFRIWNYQEGVGILSQYQNDVSDPYKKTVVQLNIAAGLVALEDLDQATLIINDLHARCVKMDYKLLLSNIEELRGQILFEKGDLQQALKLFQHSERKLRGTQNVSWLFAKKWLGITKFALNPKKKSSHLELNSVRVIARQHRHWETLRECDLYQSIYTNDKGLFSRVIHGSPHLPYKERSLKLWPYAPLSSSVVILGPRAKKTKFTFDLESGKCLNDSFQLKPDQLSHKMFCNIMKDLYSPVSVFTLFKGSFEDEYFNPFTSKDKVYKAVRKLKDQLAKHDSQIEVLSNKSFGYRIRVNEPTSFIYPSSEQVKPMSKLDVTLKEVKKHFGNQPFSRSQLAEKLGMAHRSCHRIIQESIHGGQLIKIGNGPKTLYKLVS